MKTVNKPADATASRNLLEEVLPEGRRAVPMTAVQEADRRRRFEAAMNRVFTEHRELFRRLAQ